MSNFCRECGKKFSLVERLSGVNTCKDCLIKIQTIKFDARNAIVKELILNHDLKENQKGLLKKFDDNDKIEIYNGVFNFFHADNELTEKELQTLLNLQEQLGLTNQNINYDDRIFPHQYIISLRSNNTLPVVNPVYQDGMSTANLKKNEIIHFACPAKLKEVRVISLGYAGGSRGVSLRLMKGVTYHVGSHRGQMIKEEQMIETSRGYLFITNKRLLLDPVPGKKAVSIPLNKILTYNCFNNGLEVYKDGREKGFFFSIPSSGHVEIVGLCLGHLLNNN